MSNPCKKNKILIVVIKRYKYTELLCHSDFQITDSQTENMAFVPFTTLFMQCVSLLVYST
jgi:hypothetical protein